MITYIQHTKLEAHGGEQELICSLKLLDNYNIVGLKNNLLLSTRVHCIVIRLDCLIIQPQFN